MGERQRVLIARALSADPKLVLADEPTGSLDTQRTREVLGRLHGLCRERDMAVLLATHDPQAAVFADEVHELRDGRLEAYTPDHTPVAAGPIKPGA
jgi:putative ABC transport system ATP-binding protein